MKQINGDLNDNYISVAFALKFTVDGLQDFVHGNLRILHQNINQKCAVGQCLHNCSRRYGNTFSRWCTTCQSWKKELHQLNRHRKHWDNIKWNTLDTIDFPFSYEEASKVFIQDFTSVRQGVLDDFCALMSLCRNLKVFNIIINDNLIADIQRARNTLFAHNHLLIVHDVEKSQCFSYCIALLKIPDIACTQSSKTYLNILEEMKMSKKVPRRIFENKNVQNIVAIIQNTAETIEKSPENVMTNLHLYERLDNQLRNLKLFTEPPTIMNKRKRRQTCLPFELFLAFSTFMIMCGLVSRDTEPNKGCLSVRFDEYWKSDLDFDAYVEEKSNESEIERSWIYQKIQTRNGTDKRGMLVSADMGFGKSTIVSNIVCADPMSIWYSIRQQVLVYHICRYDLILSSKPEVFVRNLAGAVVRDIPEIGNAILSDDMALDFLYGKCSIDPIACLEFSVLNKLKQKNDVRKYLIIIDAIDECETSGGTDLADLLYKKIQFFPDNFQFLITSRNIERLLYKFKELEHIDLQIYEQQNLQDIRLYLEKARQMTNAEIVKLTKISGRNFLQVKLYLEYCKDLITAVCDVIPESLGKIYMLNFERVFGKKGDLFEEFICIFEVLCSLQNPIDENKLFNVAGLRSKELKRKASRILGNELRHFIKISNGFISFQHKSISEFLTDSSRKHLSFYVDSQNGHKRFAKYLLNSLKVSKADNLVEIVHHTAMSNDSEYENILLRFVRKLQSENIRYNFTSYLNLAAKDLNCYESLKLFIKLIPYSLHQDDPIVNLTHLKSALSDAAFIAAQYGNEKSLFVLLDHGSDIMYVHRNSLHVINMDERHRIMCKHELFCEYNLLHIAAQRGNTKIVKELLRRNLTLLYQHNTMQMNAFHLAAEYGHAHVLRVFLNINSSLADSHSLYLASKNGHKEVVTLLLNYVEEKCVPCIVDISWRRTPDYSLVQLADENILVQLNLKLENGIKHKTALQSYEDFRLLTCDTPLNAAVRNGYIEIVKSLVAKSARTVNCSIYDGSIPLFTAAKYNRNEIFKLLYHMSNVSHKCKSISIDQSKLTNSELQIINHVKCPDNAGVEHLLASYDNLHLIEYLFNKGYRNWESVDREGCTPLHYAFCRGSYKFVNFFIFEKRLPLNVSSRSVNGSTPFHSAATCHSFILHQYYQKLNETKLPPIPHVSDNQGRSILQYAFNKSISADDLVRIGKFRDDDFLFSLFSVVINSRHNLLHKDIQNNNFLHYASKTGNYLGVSFIKDIKMFDKSIHLLLNQRNQNNRTPLEVAFDSLPRRESFDAVRIPHNCSWTEVFFVECKANISVLLSPHEYFILSVFQYYHEKANFSEVNMDELLEISINKSRIYPILIMKVYAEQEVKHVLEKSFMIPFLLSKSNSPHIIDLLPNAINGLHCDGKKSALHEIVHNDRNTQWTFHSLSFLNPIFKKYSAKFIDECFDDQGYNLLHRSIMGGHLNTIEYLVSKGMNVWHLSKDNNSALEICIYNSPFTDNGVIPNYYTSGSRFQTIEIVSSDEKQGIQYDSSRLISFDETATFLLYNMIKSDESKRQLIRNQLCDSNNKELGLTHIAAAKGLLLFLKSTSEIYGLKYLRCEDQFGVAPNYIADIYNQSKVVRWFRKIIRLQIKRPHKDLEDVLLFNMIDNYKSPVERDWTCLLRYRFKYTGIIRNQILKCSAKYIHVPIHHTWMFNNKTYAILHAIFLENNFTELKTMIVNLQLHILPSKYKKLMNVFLLSNSYKSICHNVMQKEAYYMMRQLQLFGDDDKHFYYRQLLSSVNKKRNTNGENTLYVSNLFDDVYRIHYRHFGKLKMRSELHQLWLNQTLFRRINNLHMFYHYKIAYEQKRKLNIDKAQVLYKLCIENRNTLIKYKIDKYGLLNFR